MLRATVPKKPMVLVAVVAVLGLWLVLISAASAHAERRVALVVGNSAYQHAPYLPNPIKDAQAMAEKFKQAGFEVVSAKYDAENLPFKRAIRYFEDIATGADIAVVYYAGHGLEISGVNYLIPVDAKLRSDRDVEDEAITLDRLVVSVEGAKRLRLVILDACRDNPFVKMKRERVARTRQIKPGLGVIAGTATDTLVAYAAKDGRAAEDGFTEHSPFTIALLKNLFTPGLDIRLAFGRIRDAVLESTGGRQEPYVYGSLGKENISLVPAPVKVAAASDDLAGVKADYQLVEKIGSERAWQVFLKQYPSGFYSDLARQQIEILAKQAPKKLAELEPPKPPAPPRPSSKEQRAWDRIKDSSDPEKLKRFIKRYPASVLANRARLQLDALERAAEERDAKARAEQERKAAERARLKAEREAKRAEEERLAKAAAEAARQKAEREAAAKRAEEERLAKAAAEAARQKAEREAATKRAEGERQAKLAEEAAQAAREAACKREEERLAALQASGKRSLGDLRRFSEEVTCERLRPSVMAALDQAAKEAEAEMAAATPSEPSKPVANTPELVLSAQTELVRIGCLDGRIDGIFGNNTRGAVERYMAEKGRPEADVEITGDFVTMLRNESSRVCPLTCAAGEVIKGERCVAAENTPELVLSAQTELVRIGCLDGRIDGILGNNTRGAVERYVAERGKPEADVEITDDFVTTLKNEPSRVCPLTCPAGEVIKGEQCVAAKKSAPLARQKGDKNKSAAARARAERDKKRRERAAERARERKERAAAHSKARQERKAHSASRRRHRRKEAIRSRPRPRVRQEAAASRRNSGGGGHALIGVGF